MMSLFLTMRKLTGENNAQRRIGPLGYRESSRSADTRTKTLGILG